MSYQSSPISDPSSSLSSPIDGLPVTYDTRVTTLCLAHLHPYARLHAKNSKKGSVPSRRIWNHKLEKSLFTAYELSTLGAAARRKIYQASLEAHIDGLHLKLLSMGFWPVAVESLDEFRGLNSKIAKSVVSGLQYDKTQGIDLKLLMLERTNDSLVKAIAKLREYPPELGSNTVV